MVVLPGDNQNIASGLNLPAPFFPPTWGGDLGSGFAGQRRESVENGVAPDSRWLWPDGHCSSPLVATSPWGDSSGAVDAERASASLSAGSGTGAFPMPLESPGQSAETLCSDACPGGLPGGAGPIAAVRWCCGPSGLVPGESAVRWVRFVSAREVAEEAAGGFQVGDDVNQTIPPTTVALSHGEHIRMLRGSSTSCSELPRSASPRAADWMEILTSDFRHLTLGHVPPQDACVPTFTFKAEPDHEICGATLGPDGAVVGVLQRPLLHQPLLGPSMSTAIESRL